MIMTQNMLDPQLVQLRDQFRLRGFDLKFVGGCVRDLCVGVDPKDWDLHTDATPDECAAIYNEHGVRWEPTGIDHGTCTVILNHVAYEITSLRADVATDGRRATVAYTRDWITDLSRRDFRFNSMSMSFEGDILDPFDGQTDLTQGQVRFVGDPVTRMQEDYLRILRWFRFRGRFGMHMDDETRQQVVACAPGLAHISRERIWSEMHKILQLSSGAQLVREMYQMGMQEHVGLPVTSSWWINPDAWITQAQQVVRLGGSPVTVLVSLFGNQARVILQAWKASRQDQDLARWLHDNRSQNPYRLMAVHGASHEWAQQLATLTCMNPFDVALIADWQVPEFPVTGYDLIKLGLKPGPQYGLIMITLRNTWADSGYLMCKQQLLDQVQV